MRGRTTLIFAHRLSSIIGADRILVLERGRRSEEDDRMEAVVELRKELLNDRLVDYVMPDVAWCGGISEMRKIANLAESFYIPVTPHDASGPINILAGAHTMMTVPNFYKLEFNHAALNIHNAVIDEPLDIRGGVLHLSEKPGLGVELNEEFLDAHPDPDWNSD